MERNIKIDAIVLKKLQIGESNIGVTLLTERDEVIFVMAFGATKVKNKHFGAVNPFVQGLWDLYFDPVKKHWRVKEITVKSYNDELQLSLENFYTASLFSEIILKSQGSERGYDLLTRSISCLKEEGYRVYILVQFLLRYLSYQGVLSSFNSCSSCSRVVSREPLFYVGYDGLICNKCLSSGRFMEINPGVLIYCCKTLKMTLVQSLKIGLDKNSLLQLKSFLITLIKKHTEGKLLTLDSCDGLI